MTQQDHIVELLKNHDVATFKDVCRHYVRPMENIAFAILVDANQAETVVTSVLGRLWARGDFSRISGSLQEFLSTEISIACLQEKECFFIKEIS